MEILNYYLIIINIIGFILYIINMMLYRYTQKGQVDKLLTFTSYLGGSGGIILSIILFDRNLGKENMMSRVFVICIFIIQLIIYLMMLGYSKGTFSLPIIEYFNKRPYLLIYLLIINIIAFILYGLDKLFAMKDMWRIKIVTLLFVAFIGGSIGAFGAMHLFRHKTNKDYFYVGIPLIILMQLFVFVYLSSK